MISKPIDRVDGILKVTGQAKYAAEFNVPGVVYAMPVRAKIAKGTIKSIDTSAAKKAAGVLAVITHDNAPKLTELDPKKVRETSGNLGEDLVPLQDNKVHYFGQYVALVVAETFEQANYAASLVEPVYNADKPDIDLSKMPNARNPDDAKGENNQVDTGKVQGIIQKATHKTEQSYSTPTENHHPMEPHATVAVWESSDRLKVYDATQAVIGDSGILAYLFGLERKNVHVISPFVGGAFGCKGSVWGHVVLSAMGAKVVDRPVKLAITRQMMVTNVGRRPETIQTVAMGTDDSGALAAISHHTDTYGNLSDFYELCGRPTKVLYNAPDREITYKVAKLNINTPTYMRAPGETPGSFALESAIDEMAHAANIDPVQFRVRNHTSQDPVNKNPYSSENLLECYRIGAEKFDWSRRNMQPGQNRNGHQLVGYGMATATYPAYRSTASVKVQMSADGKVTVLCATQDLGTGTYTILAQTASAVLGVPVNDIIVKIGDSTLPPAPVSGGSQTVASVNPAVLTATKTLRNDLLQLALADKKSALKGKKTEEVAFENGRFFLKSKPAKSDSYADIMRRNGRKTMEACFTANPKSGLTSQGAKEAPCMPANIPDEENRDTDMYSFHSFGAHFVEVWVDADLGTIRVKKVVSVQDVGRVMNEKTARSQIMGGIIYGLGAGLMEETLYDKRYGNPIQRSLADYHVPVNFDVPDIDVFFIGKPDPHISPIGARGIGEIGTTGIAAAIANAVFNATGKRIRSQPLTPDKLLLYKEQSS
ncbi:xanthine dehydrogenase family protein molybdopterin-binding subunit [Pontibacter sp. CAU 1760]